MLWSFAAGLDRPAGVGAARRRQTDWKRRTADATLVRLVRTISERVSAFVCAACRDPEDPFLEVVPWGTWRSIVRRCIVLHVDGGHHAPPANDVPGGCTTLLLGRRAGMSPVGLHDGRVQSGDQELRSGPIARLGVL